jgi:hypothetical protein
MNLLFVALKKYLEMQALDSVVYRIAITRKIERATNYS